jgi:CheY-like chemotaxis protein
LQVAGDRSKRILEPQQGGTERVNIHILLIGVRCEETRLLAFACQSRHLPCHLDIHATGQAGFEALRRMRDSGLVPDLVIIDVAESGALGLDILELIRRDGRNRASQVLALTRSAAPVDPAIGELADGIVSVPASLDEWRQFADFLGERASSSRDTLSIPVRRDRMSLRVPHLLHVDASLDDSLRFARAFAASGIAGVLHSFAEAADALFYLNRSGDYREARRPKLIITDAPVTCPDGRDFLDVLRANRSFKSIPVLVLAGRPSFSDEQRYRRLGIEEFLEKPRRDDDLVRLIASFDHWLVGSSNGLSLSLT